MLPIKLNRSLSILIPALALVNIAFLICYIFFAYKYQFHADSAVANTLAQEIKETGRFFPPGWHYANGDVWVLFLHAFELPLLSLMRNGYAAHAFASLLGAGLVLLVAWQLGAVTNMSRRARWTGLALLASGMSPNMAENLFGQQAYGMLFWIGALILVAAWHYLQSRQPSRYGWMALTLTLVFLAAWGNPQRALVYMVLPMLFGAAVASWRVEHAEGAGQQSPVRSHIAILGLVALLASIVGARLHGAILALNGGLDQVMVPTWLSFDGMVHNALALLRGVLSLLGGFPVAGTLIISGDGVISAARFGAALALLFLLPWALWQAAHSKRAGQRYFTAATTASLLISVIIYLMTSVPDSSNPESSIRYLVPGLIGALLILMQTLVDERAAPRKRWLGILAVIVLIISAPVAYGLKSIHGTSMAKQDTANELMATVRFLQAQHAQYGYASYWNAGNTTVLSSHTVKVRQVIIVKGLPYPHRVLGSDRWYEASTWQGPTFLLLSTEEDALIDWVTMTMLSGAPRLRVAYKQMVYVEYDHNIARDLPLWSVDMTQPSRFTATADTAHSVGQYDPRAGEIRAAKGEAGALRFGPYTTLAAGRYDVTFDLSAVGEQTRDFGHADVVASGGNVALARTTIEHPGAQRLVLSFSIPETVNNVEFRIFSNGTGELAWTNVTVHGHPLQQSTTGIAHGR